ncbi:MAG: oligosaccharide flippase family protein, partial [Lachnospiraceae bacterium]|nr:oligosaccharide flippase family protein [Lachnospiraceae bacterium]
MKQFIISIKEHFNTASPATKSSMVLLLSNFILKGLSMISGPIFTRIMTTEQYGIVSNFTSWQSLLGTVVTLNLGAGVFNNGMLEFKKDRDSFQISLVVISSITSVLFLLMVLFFPTQVCNILDINETLCIVLFLYFLFTPVYGYWAARQRYEFKYKSLFILSVGSAVVSLLISVISVYYCPTNYTSTVKIVLSELPNIILGLFFLIYIAYKSKFNVKIRYIIYALKFNIPLIPHYLSMYVLSSSDRIMITKLVSVTATAIYSVSYTVGMVINILWQSIEASMSPWIYEKLSINEKESVRKRTYQVLVVFMITCILSCLFAPEIIIILAPKEYYNGVYVIPSIAASSFFIAAYSIYMRIELFHKKTEFATVATTLAAVLNLLLNSIFISKFGFIAAGYTTLVCYI